MGRGIDCRGLSDEFRPQRLGALGVDPLPFLPSKIGSGTVGVQKSPATCKFPAKFLSSHEFHSAQMHKPS